MTIRTGNKTELDSLRECYRYNSYVRKRYLQALEKLPHEQLVRDRGASYPSLLQIFIHVLGAYTYWLMIKYPGLSKEEVERISKEDVDETSLEAAKKLEKEVDSFVMNFVERLDDEKLASTFEITTRSGKREEITVSQMLWHLIEEELQHRGELNALFWQMDMDPPVTSWLAWKVETGEVK
ncbi:MAG: DinB family protein [Nitrososphaerales archaeon]